MHRRGTRPDTVHSTSPAPSSARRRHVQNQRYGLHYYRTLYSCTAVLSITTCRTEELGRRQDPKLKGLPSYRGSPFDHDIIHTPRSGTPYSLLEY